MSALHRGLSPPHFAHDVSFREDERQQKRIRKILGEASRG